MMFRPRGFELAADDRKQLREVEGAVSNSLRNRR
jgi:hypothetical protein